jgi:hypothetical protein
MIDELRHLFAFVGPLLMVALILHLILRRFRERLIYPWVLLGGALPAVLLPLQGLPVAGYIRGVLGDFSIVTLLLLGSALWFGFGNGAWLNDSSRFLLLAAIAVVGALFYPPALGLTGFDPYQLGYAGLFLPSMFLLLSLTAWFTGRRGLAVLLLLPVAAYNLQLLESDNLWDYLLDPWLVIYSWMWLLKGLFSRACAHTRFKRARHRES